MALNPGPYPGAALATVYIYERKEKEIRIMAKLKGMTNEELAKVIEESGFLAKGRFEDQKEAVKEEGVIGIAETAKGNFMVYCVGEGKKLFNTSVHPTKELANGKAAQRILAIAAEDVAEDEAEDTAEGVAEKTA